MKDYMLRAAVKKLSGRVEDQRVYSRREACNSKDRIDEALYKGAENAFDYVQAEMRTLFAGLIELEEK